MRVYQMDENKLAETLGSDAKIGLRTEPTAARGDAFSRFLHTLRGIVALHRSKFYYADLIAAVCFLIAIIFSCLNRSWSLFYMTLAALGVSLALYFIESTLLYRYKKRFFDRLSTARQRVRVIRAGQEQEISPGSLLPGDLVVLEPGTILYADARVLSADNLYVDEQYVFGSSIPSAKTSRPLQEENLTPENQKNMVWKGSFVSSGRGICMVTALEEDCYVEKTGGRRRKRQRSFFYNKQNNIGHISSYIYIVLVAISLLIAVIFTNRYVEAFLVMAAMTTLMFLNPVSCLTEWTYYRTAEKLYRQGVLIRNIEAFDGMNREQTLYYDAEDFLRDRLTFAEVINFHGTSKSSLSYFSLCMGPGYFNEMMRPALEQYQLSYERLNRSFPIYRREQDDAGNLFSLFSDNGKSVAVAVGYWQKMLPYVKGLDRDVLDRIDLLEQSGKMVWIMASQLMDFIPNKLDFSYAAGQMSITALLIFNIPVQKNVLNMIGQLRRAKARVELVSDYTETLSRSIAAMYDMDGLQTVPPEKPCYTMPQLRHNTLIALETASPIEKDQALVVLENDRSPQQVIYQVKCMFCGLRRCLNFMAVFGLFLIFTVLTLFLHDTPLEEIIYPALLIKPVLVIPFYYLIESVSNCNQFRRSLLLGLFCGAAGYIAALVRCDMALFTLGASATLLSVVLLLSSRHFRPFRQKDPVLLICAALAVLLPWFFMGGGWLTAVLFALFPPIAAFILDLFY